MYHLLICEDMPVILKGLVKIVQNFGFPLEISTAVNGEEGLRIFTDQPIDLVMTDIRMPGCDGLELIRRMRELRSGFQGIIISGYDDFSYAKTAIHLGISDYLLKPVDPDELREALTHCIEKLSRQVSQSQILSLSLAGQIQDAWASVLPEETLQYLRCVDDGFFHGASFGLLLFHSDRQVDGLSSAPTEYVRDFLFNRFSRFLLFPVHGRFFCVIVNLTQGEEADFFSLQDSLEPHLLQYRAETGIRLFCGIGSKAETIFQLPEAISRAETALYGRFAPGSKPVLSGIGGEDSCLAFLPDIVSHTNVLCHHLNLAELISIEKDVDALFSIFRQSPASLPLLSECLCRLKDAISQDDGTALEEFSPFLLVQNADTLEQLAQELKEELSILCKRRLKDQLYPQDPVSLAIQYMEENYAKPLSLAILANVVSLNYTYFSSIFKSQTGVNAIAYLQSLRIQKAKALLLSTNDRVGEIAHKTGFPDERYFVKLFKRSEGITPGEYRRAMGTALSDSM